ncbi:G2/M phase-specific E3 ubiquitin-protein ligase-like [Nothobranchius furzeri]|uniref:G2/M phase-specific E3 ubiquitin-protein ligase-like n=1 Tax=Nothobranchius furzeri TaxID=105023 RepID=UPI0039046C1A
MRHEPVQSCPRFMDGLQTLEVSSAIINNHETLKILFVGGLQTISLQDMQDLFSVQHAEPGSNKRRLENQTIYFWNDWLMEVDGVDTVPPLGFSHRPVIEFLHVEHGNRRIFPEANTCEVILRLPVHPTYNIFVEYMESGILQSPTFGFI